MEITITQAELQAGLYLDQGVVEKRSTTPILQNVLVQSVEGGVVIKATDNEIAVGRLCAATVKKKGTLTTNARKLYEMVRELPEGEIKIKSLDNNWIELVSGKARFRVVGMDPREFPEMMEPPAANVPAVKISSQVLAGMFDRTIFAVSGDDGRPNLNGVFVQRAEDGRLRMVATDGHRLAMVTRPAEGEGLQEGVILSRRSVLELKKALEGEESDVEMILAGGVMHVRRGPVRLSTRLVDGQFPDYKQVIPEKGDRLVLIDIDVFAKALRRVSVVSSDRTKGVRLQIEANRMQLSASSELGDATDEIDVEYDGEPMAIGFNARYIIDALAVMPAGGRVEITLIDEVSPGVMRETGDLDYCYIVMPMRL